MQTDKILTSIKSNLGTIILVIVLLVFTFSPKVKSKFMSVMVRTGIFDPDVSNLSPKAASPAVQTAEAAPLAPSAKFSTADGQTVDLTDLKGKVVFLNFWATWCPPCVAEMPSVNSLYSKMKDNPNVVFMLADADQDLKKSTTFMKNNNYDLPVYIPNGPVPDVLFSGSLPTTVIINKKGEIVYSHPGMANYDTPEMVDLLKELSE